MTHTGIVSLLVSDVRHIALPSPTSSFASFVCRLFRDRFSSVRASSVWSPSTLAQDGTRHAPTLRYRRGFVSVFGVYGLTDKFPMGVRMNKGLTLRTAQQHAQRYLPQFFDYVQQGDLDPSILITHDLPLDEGLRGYDMFKNNTDGCIRVTLRP